jgi:holliday junction DNA helicase RuvA
MIAKLTGLLAEKAPPSLLIDVGGVGYEVQASMTTFYTLPELGNHVSLFTHFIVREDAQLLFGFSSRDERSAFCELIKVSGVGARTALSVLSGLSVTDLQQIIAAQDASRLLRVPGIGKKTADRLLLELKGKLGNMLDTSLALQVSGIMTDISQALMALGYNEKEAATALKALPKDISINDGIKLALKNLTHC